MKLIILSFTCALVFAITSTHAHAQKADNTTAWKEPENEAAYVPADKPTSGIKENHNIIYKINIKAVRHFRHTFPLISNEKWNILKDGYYASYSSNDVFQRVYYNKWGRWLYSILRYDETKLPRHIRASVKSVYYDYAINFIDELHIASTDPKPVYLVHLKYNNTLKIIRVSDGEMEEIRL